MDLNTIMLRHSEWVDSMGWHNKTALEYIALIASEVGEAANECRGAVPTDRLGEELADIMLRVLDLAFLYGIDMEKECLDKMRKNRERGTRGRLK